MKRFGVEVQLKNVPCLDKEFMPILRFNRAFLATAKKPFSVAVERADGQMASCNTFIHGTEEMFEADCYYVERLVKTILWMKGGYKVYVSGDEKVYEYLKSTGEDFKIMVLPDHPTPVRLRTHTIDPVPFFIYSSAEELEGVESFDEESAATTGLDDRDGYTLMDRLVK